VRGVIIMVYCNGQPTRWTTASEHSTLLSNRLLILLPILTLVTNRISYTWTCSIMAVILQIFSWRWESKVQKRQIFFRNKNCSIWLVYYCNNLITINGINNIKNNRELLFILGDRWNFVSCIHGRSNNWDSLTKRILNWSLQIGRTVASEWDSGSWS